MATVPTIRLMAVGDIMLGDSSHFLGRGVGTRIARSPEFDPLVNVRPLLNEADTVFANLESPVAAQAGKTSWEAVYRAAPEALRHLQFSGHTVVSVANNHVLEHGVDVFDETCQHLDKAQLGRAGFATDGSRDAGVCRWQHNGLSVSLFAESLIPEFSGRPVDPQSQIDRLADELAQDDADIKIVSLHWGHEYVQTPSSAQRRFARQLVDAGARVIIGHHPHVLQSIELIEQSLVAYSLGNFLFDQDWTEATRSGGILDLTLSAGGVENWRFLPTRCDGQCQPDIATGSVGAAIRETTAPHPFVGEKTYQNLLQAGSHQHRIAMKLELLRHFWRVRRQTIHFLLTKRKRPRPLWRRAG